MVLTEEQIEHFYREGYVVAPQLVPHESIDKALADVRAGDSPGGSWSARVFDHASPLADASMHRLLVEPNVVAAAQEIFESEPRVYYGMLAIVPSRGGNGLPWHQDNQYSPILGGALNVFVAMCDITPDMAILWVAPGTHLLGIQPSKANDSSASGHREAVVEPENGFALPTMRKGDAAIFDRSTYHRSLTNQTDRLRFAYAAQYQADAARDGRTGKKDPLRMRAIDLEAQWRKAGLL